MFLSSFVHWGTAKLQTRVRHQLRMPEQLSVHSREMSRPVPGLMRRQRSLQCLQPRPGVHMHRRLHRRSVQQLLPETASTSRAGRRRSLQSVTVRTERAMQGRRLHLSARVSRRSIRGLSTRMRHQLRMPEKQGLHSEQVPRPVPGNMRRKCYL